LEIFKITHHLIPDYAQFSFDLTEPEANDAIIVMAAVSHPRRVQTKVVVIMSPNKREEVCSAFVDVVHVHRENKRTV